MRIFFNTYLDVYDIGSSFLHQLNTAPVWYKQECGPAWVYVFAGSTKSQHGRKSDDNLKSGTSIIES